MVKRLVEKGIMRDQRKRIFARLSRLSVKYRKISTETTIAGGSEQSFIPPSLSLSQDVVEFEQAAVHEDVAHQSTTFMGHVFQLDEKPRSIAITELAELVPVAENYFWIDLSNYVAEDLQTIAQALQIHTIAVQSALSSWKNPRLDVFGDHFFVAATLPTLETEPYRVQVHQVNLFVGKNFLLSAHQIALPFTERALMRCILHTENSQMQSVFLLYVLLDELLAYYEDLNEQIQMQIEHMEERALLDTSDNFLTDLLHFKRYAFSLSQLADQHRSLFAVFLRPDFHYIPEQDVMLYYRDLETRFSRLTETLRASKESVNGIFTIYVSHVSHRTNSVMKILTMVSTVLLPSTLILAFFSTNDITDIPLLTHTFGFTVMILSIICVSGAILWRFRHKGWW